MITLLFHLQPQYKYELFHIYFTNIHSRPQRTRSFWSAPRIATSGQVQHRNFAIHGLPVTLRVFRVKFDKSDWFWSQSIVFTKPFNKGIPLEQSRFLVLTKRSAASGDENDKYYKRRTRWNANRCYSLRTTSLIFETFQILFPTAPLIFTAVKLFHEVI